MNKPLCLSLEDEELYLPPVKLWVLHPDWPAGPQWRRCEMRVMRDVLGGTHVSFKVRRLAGGADIQDLFESRGFHACLDRVFEDILRAGLPDHVPDARQHYLINASSKGASAPDSGSPSMGYNVAYEVRDMLNAMSNHERLALQRAADAIAARQEAHRAAFGPVS